MQIQTTNHEEIKHWVEENGGVPAILDYKDAKGDDKGIRIDFPGEKDESLLSTHQTRDTSWENFFSLFDKEDLMFIYDKDPQGDDPTAWYRFAKRQKAD